jgi:1-aminocyclopropane-1-carboxylate deaminase/D-cysteine desulfhydrase-like pyridoxal-dependent ACC family enzyme
MPAGLTAGELRARVQALSPEVAALPVSPFEKWELSFGSLWVKRDDLLGEGGTKLRKLMAELPAARARGQRVLTFGYLDSNHALATARLGAKWGVPVELQLLGKESEDPGRAALFRSVAPTEIHSGVVGLVLATARRMLVARLRRERLVRFPPGGTTPRTTAAVALAVAEVVSQCEALGERVPEDWVVAVGTGGTQAGLLAGARALGLSVRVHGVAASSRWVGPRRVSRLANQALRLIGVEARVRPSEVDVGWEQFGGGHARSTPESETVLRQLSEQGHELDPIFTAKALAWVKAKARSGERWLFWHTGTAVK